MFFNVQHLSRIYIIGHILIWVERFVSDTAYIDGPIITGSAGSNTENRNCGIHAGYVLIAGKNYMSSFIILRMWFFKRWRRNRIKKQPFPMEWLAIIEQHVPIYRKLPLLDKEELKQHILVFMAEKHFFGCGGLTLTDEIKVTIAAQACILLLHRETDYYPGLNSILVYPAAYIAKETRHLAGGVVEEGYDIRLGESWRHGAVVLSWDDVRRSSADIHDGHNVVFHEFAHQLDSSEGRGDSSEVLQHQSTFIPWARVLGQNFQKLQQELSNNRSTLLGSYAGKDPAEFFAVATEYFFERPKDLLKAYPDLYRELSKFYHQEPASM